MEELLNKVLYLPEKRDGEVFKKEAYIIKSINKELETDKNVRVNFLLISQSFLLKDLNIKLNIAGKTTDEIKTMLFNKVKETIGENSVMKEAILILKQLNKKITIDIKPIFYNNKLVFNLTIDNKIKATVYNDNVTTNELLENWGYYDEYKNAIDFMKVYNKKPYSKELLKLLINKKEDIDFELIKNVAREYTFKEKEEVYRILERFIPDKLKESKYYKYFEYRKKYSKYYNTVEHDKLSKVCTLRWLKQETALSSLVNDPSNFDLIFKLEFKNIESKYRETIAKLENELKKFWNHYEDKVNKLLNNKFKIVMCKFDFILEDMLVKAINNSKSKEYVINIRNMEQDVNNMINDFIKEE